MGIAPREHGCSEQYKGQTRAVPLFSCAPLLVLVTRSLSSQFVPLPSLTTYFLLGHTRYNDFNDPQWLTHLPPELSSSPPSSWARPPPWRCLPASTYDSTPLLQRLADTYGFLSNHRPPAADVASNETHPPHHHHPHHHHPEPAEAVKAEESKEPVARREWMTFEARHKHHHHHKQPQAPEAPAPDAQRRELLPRHKHHHHHKQPQAPEAPAPDAQRREWMTFEAREDMEARDPGYAIQSFRTVPRN